MGGALNDIGVQSRRETSWIVKRVGGLNVRIVQFSVQFFFLTFSSSFDLVVDLHATVKMQIVLGATTTHEEPHEGPD